jgi:hypothetical protein
MLNPFDGYSSIPLQDPSFKQVGTAEKPSSEDQKCNPNPSFSLPNKRGTKQGFIPSGLLRQAQERRAKIGDQEAFLSGKECEKLSEEMRRQRMETYFPSKKDEK